MTLGSGRVLIHFALGEFGERGIGFALFFEAIVQHALVVTELELTGEGRRVP